VRYIFECGKGMGCYEIHEVGGTFISHDWDEKYI
jgi:hypothetical protein